jgi:hypothetical protein
MKKYLVPVLFLSVLVLTLCEVGSVRAGEADILIQKLVEKGVLSESDAKEIVTEIQKESAKTEKKETAQKESTMEIPSWVKKIKPKGDLRLRHDTQWQEKEDLAGVTTQDNNRNRERFRLRVGLEAQVSDTTLVDVLLASGAGEQNTTNQSFGGHARGKDLWIDLASVQWAPCPYFTGVAGKHKNPLFTTSLVWDSDVNPEGLSETFKYGINDQFSLFANFGQWVMEEISSTNSDPWLLAWQLGTEIKPVEDVGIQLGVTYYNFMKLDRIKHDADDIDDDETFIGYNDKTQQMVFDSNGELLNEFSCLELQGKLKFSHILPVPFALFGSYIKNFDADIDDLVEKGSPHTNATNPAALLLYNGDDRDQGWLIGFEVGDKKKQGDWHFAYNYQVLEDYAFPAVFVDSDFHSGGTNNKGHKVGIHYVITDYLTAGATGYLTQRDDEDKQGLYDENRIQLDMIYKF